MSSKHGQGMSLNVIIVAVLALVILVVLVAIFTGKIGDFNIGVNRQGSAELSKMKITYGTCHPTSTQETSFADRFGNAEGDEQLRQTLRDEFENEISRCRNFNTKNDCASNTCKWS